MQGVTVSSIQTLNKCKDSAMTFADFERKIVYLIDNAKQVQENLTKNTIEIKKILEIKIY